jgi:hypothetical protein
MVCGGCGCRCGKAMDYPYEGRLIEGEGTAFDDTAQAPHTLHEAPAMEVTYYADVGAEGTLPPRS